MRAIAIAFFAAPLACSAILGADFSGHPPADGGADATSSTGGTRGTGGTPGTGGVSGTGGVPVGGTRCTGQFTSITQLPINDSPNLSQSPHRDAWAARLTSDQLTLYFTSWGSIYTASPT